MSVDKCHLGCLWSLSGRARCSSYQDRRRRICDPNGGSTYTHSHVHAHIHSYIHAYFDTHIHSYIHAYFGTHIYSYTHAYFDTHIYTYAHRIALSGGRLA